jgi:hypothetical protein
MNNPPRREKMKEIWRKELPHLTPFISMLALGTPKTIYLEGLGRMVWLQEAVSNCLPPLIRWHSKDNHCITRTVNGTCIYCKHNDVKLSLQYQQGNRRSYLHALAKPHGCLESKTKEKSSVYLCIGTGVVFFNFISWTMRYVVTHGLNQG